MADWLSPEGFEPVRHLTAGAALADIEGRSFDLLIADAAFAFGHRLHSASRARRPSTPTIVIGDAAAARQSESINRQVMYLPRPIERPLLVCTASMAIADGRPLRCSARKPAHRFEAIVNGIPSYIIDVSNEGLRLEMPRERCAIPPPYFNARVPHVGVAVIVQRMWARTRSGDGAVTLCGGALAQNTAKAAGAWRSFVDTIPSLSARSVQIQ
jgi:hypothetical protein